MASARVGTPWRASSSPRQRGAERPATPNAGAGSEPDTDKQGSDGSDTAGDDGSSEPAEPAGNGSEDASPDEPETDAGRPAEESLGEVVDADGSAAASARSDADSGESGTEIVMRLPALQHDTTERSG